MEISFAVGFSQRNKEISNENRPGIRVEKGLAVITDGREFAYYNEIVKN